MEGVEVGPPGLHPKQLLKQRPSGNQHHQLLEATLTTLVVSFSIGVLKHSDIDM